MSGITSQGLLVLGGSWYLSAMIISLLILYPLITLNYEWATNILFPIIGILGIGIIYTNYNGLFENHIVFNYVIKVGLLRGFCETALGAWGYEISSRIMQIRFTKFSIVVLTIIKYICFVSVTFLACFNSDTSLLTVMFILCFSGIILSFSQKTYNIHYNLITKYLGKISLPLYITHQIFKKMAIFIFGVNIEWWQLILIIIVSIIGACSILFFTDGIVKYLKKYKHIFISGDIA